MPNRSPNWSTATRSPFERSYGPDMKHLPIPLLVILCLTLGLAPFVPEPHLWQKLKMLAGGTLTRPIDIFDLVLHGVPFVLLALRLLAGGNKRSR